MQISVGANRRQGVFHIKEVWWLVSAWVVIEFMVVTKHLYKYITNLPSISQFYMVLGTPYTPPCITWIVVDTGFQETLSSKNICI